MKRKEKSEWIIPRNKLFEIATTKKLYGINLICSICKNDFLVNKTKIYITKAGKEHKKQYYVCYRCAKAKAHYRQRYGFWLRFASEHFIPCDKCQEKLNEILTLQSDMVLNLKDSYGIRLNAYKNHKGLPEFTFVLSFVSPTPTTSHEFKPCDDCQGKLWHIFSKKELHIGSENKPMVELWRKWKIVDEKDQA